MPGKRFWLVFGLVFVLSVAASAYMMFLGPTRIDLAGKTIQEMLDSGAIFGAAAGAFSLIIVIIVMVSLYRTMNPTEIKNGIKVRGEITEVSDTGTTLNENPQIKLVIDFKKNDGTPCQGSVKTIVSRLNAALVRSGCKVDIKYDPNKPERIQLVQVYLAESAAPETDLVQRLSDLQDLCTKGLITEDDYQRRKEEILKEV
jgi:uncharacterized membrane protein